MTSSVGFENADEADQAIGYELGEELDLLRAEWTAMSPKRRTKAWDRFTQDIDERRGLEPLPPDPVACLRDRGSDDLSSAEAEGAMAPSALIR